MRRRRAVLFLMLAAGVPLVVASTAWACANLSTIRLDTRATAPGSTVKALGRNYNSGTSASDVTVRLGGRRGAVVATSPKPGLDRKITPTLQIPADIKPGTYVVVATQNVTNAAGETVPAAGTPGRASLRITGAASRSSAAALPWSSSPSGPSGSDTAVADGSGSGGSTIPLGFLSLALLAGGATLLGRGKLTASHRPQSA